MLNDFILGEQHHPLYPYRFNVEVIRRNLLNLMRSLRAHIVSLVVWFDLLLSFPLLFVVHDIYMYVMQELDITTLLVPFTCGER